MIEAFVTLLQWILGLIVGLFLLWLVVRVGTFSYLQAKKSYQKLEKENHEQET